MVHKALFLALIVITVLLPVPSALSVAPKTQPRALILASTEKEYPMQYVDQMTAELKHAGYDITFLNGSSITVSFFTTQLNKYDVLIWRTDSFALGNTTYWYLGNQNNQTNYEGAIGIGSVAVTNGMVAVSDEFFSNAYGSNALAHIKLAILISSMSITIAQSLIEAGVTTTIDFYQTLDAPPSLFDWVTQSLVGYLTTGSAVRDAIYKTIYNYEYAGSLDDTYLPPISFLGNGNLQIT